MIAAFVVPSWLLYMGGISLSSMAVIGLIGCIIRALRKVFTVEAALPTLLEIAAEFKENGGSSLRDCVNDIQTAVAKLDRKMDDNLEERKQWEASHDKQDNDRFGALDKSLRAISKFDKS